MFCPAEFVRLHTANFDLKPNHVADCLRDLLNNNAILPTHRLGRSAAELDKLLQKRPEHFADGVMILAPTLHLRSKPDIRQIGLATISCPQGCLRAAFVCAIFRGASRFVHRISAGPW